MERVALSEPADQADGQRSLAVFYLEAVGRRVTGIVEDHVLITQESVGQVIDGE